MLCRSRKLSSLGLAQGLASDSIYKILEDSRGIFWMSGPNGISSVTRNWTGLRSIRIFDPQLRSTVFPTESKLRKCTEGLNRQAV